MALLRSSFATGHSLSVRVGTAHTGSLPEDLTPYTNQTRIIVTAHTANVAIMSSLTASHSRSEGGATTSPNAACLFRVLADQFPDIAAQLIRARSCFRVHARQYISANILSSMISPLGEPKRSRSFNQTMPVLPCTGVGQRGRMKRATMLTSVSSNSGIKNPSPLLEYMGGLALYIDALRSCFLLRGGRPVVIDGSGTPRGTGLVLWYRYGTQLLQISR